MRFPLIMASRSPCPESLAGRTYHIFAHHGGIRSGCAGELSGKPKFFLIRKIAEEQRFLKSNLRDHVVLAVPAGRHHAASPSGPVKPRSISGLMFTRPASEPGPWLS